MKKIIALLLALTATTFIFCSCSKDSGSTDSNVSSESETASQTSLSESSAVDESDLFSFIIKIDGKNILCRVIKASLKKTVGMFQVRQLMTYLKKY